MKHTPTPWRTNDRAILAITNDKVCACDMFPLVTEEQRANAAHIVKCVNLHDELVAFVNHCANIIPNVEGNTVTPEYIRSKGTLEAEQVATTIEFARTLLAKVNA